MIQRRRGVTVVEVIVVVSIIALLITLSLPAIQSSREAARRTQCANNMRQYGIAFAAFEGQNKAYPSGFTARIQGPLMGDPQCVFYNYMAELLPYLDAGSIAAQMDKDRIFCDSQNLAAIQAQIPTAICPSAPDRDATPTSAFVPSLALEQAIGPQPVLAAVLKKLDAKYGASFEAAVTDYAVPAGATAGIARYFGVKVPEDSLLGLEGVFPWPVQDVKTLVAQATTLVLGSEPVEFSRRTSLEKIPDGLSQTFILTEVAGRPDRWVNGAHVIPNDPQVCAWADPRTALQIDGRNNEGPRTIIQSDNGDEIYSFHTQCVNFLFADGHVKTVSIDTDPVVILGWLTPNGGDGK